MQAEAVVEAAVVVAEAEAAEAQAAAVAVVVARAQAEAILIGVNMNAVILTGATHTQANLRKPFWQASLAE
jgi:hypothetical protein